jgi:hypothetical protein
MSDIAKTSTFNTFPTCSLCHESHMRMQSLCLELGNAKTASGYEFITALRRTGLWTSVKSASKHVANYGQSPSPQG